MQQATTQETLVEVSQLLQRLKPETTAAIDNLSDTGFPAI